MAYGREYFFTQEGVACVVPVLNSFISTTITITIIFSTTITIVISWKLIIITFSFSVLIFVVIIVAIIVFIIITFTLKVQWATLRSVVLASPFPPSLFHKNVFLFFIGHNLVPASPLPHSQECIFNNSVIIIILITITIVNSAILSELVLTQSWSLSVTQPSLDRFPDSLESGLVKLTKPSPHSPSKKHSGEKPHSKYTMEKNPPHSPFDDN